MSQQCEFTDHNPMTFVRQSAERRTVPEVLLLSEINRLAYSLRNRERMLVLLGAGTGLRIGELFGLRWGHVDSAGKQVSVVRSILKQTIGPCKTEASQKPVPLDPANGSRNKRIIRLGHFAELLVPNQAWSLSNYCAGPAFKRNSHPRCY